ncbi:MAG: hypothetical protein ABID54_04030 [Pseudomonadota bacterium]
MQGRLLRCVQCNEVINLTEHDFAAEYHYDKEKDLFTEEVKNDRKPFMTKHRGHETEELKVNRASFISDRPYSEPLKTCYFEATNGTEDFVIKKWRNRIDSPVRYEAVRGRIEITKIELDVQAESIRRQIQREMNPPISEDKMTLLIKVVERVVSQLDPKTLLEDALDLNNPLFSYCKLRSDTIKTIIELSKGIFEEEEFKKIRHFIYENSDYDGVMSPLVKRQFEIKRSPQVGKKSGKKSIIGIDIAQEVSF